MNVSLLMHILIEIYTDATTQSSCIITRAVTDSFIMDLQCMYVSENDRHPTVVMPLLGFYFRKSEQKTFLHSKKKEKINPHPMY